VNVAIPLAFLTFMSAQFPNAKVAVSHDNDWCAVIREVGPS